MRLWPIEHVQKNPLVSGSCWASSYLLKGHHYQLIIGIAKNTAIAVRKAVFWRQPIVPSIYIYAHNISGWWFGTWILWVPFSRECHHPNWRTPSFFWEVGLNHQPDIDLGKILWTRFKIVGCREVSAMGSRSFRHQVDGAGCAPLRWIFQGSRGEDGTVKKKAKLIEGNGTEDSNY